MATLPQWQWARDLQWAGTGFQASCFPEVLQSVRPFLPQPYLMGPQSTPRCMEAHERVRKPTSTSSIFISYGKKLPEKGVLRLQGKDPGSAAGFEESPGKNLERRRRTKPPPHFEVEGQAAPSPVPSPPPVSGAVQPDLPHSTPALAPGFSDKQGPRTGMRGSHAQSHTPRRPTAGDTGPRPVVAVLPLPHTYRAMPTSSPPACTDPA